MKKTTIIFIISLLGNSLFAQILFEKGYFKDSTNKKVSCLIKNVDWKNNPNKFEYMLSENAMVQTATINNVIEFGIDNFSKYVKAKVKIDRSSDYSETLSEKSQPLFVEEIVFLLVLEEGKANLYQFEDSNIKRFFYKVEDSTIEPLVYKRYAVSATQTAKNVQFRQTLTNYVRCEKTSVQMIDNLNYNKKDLLKYFRTYNQYFEIEKDKKLVINDDKKLEKFKFRVTGFANYISLNLNSPDYNINIISPNATIPNKFKEALTVGIGGEAEYIMPFNKNKWRIFMNPNIHYYNGERVVNSAVATVKYMGFEFPLGVRYNIFLNKDNVLTLDGGWCIEKAKKNQITFNPNIIALDFGLSSGIFIGGGYNFKQFGIEMRYYAKRDILDYYLVWGTEFQKLSTILYYTF